LTVGCLTLSWLATAPAPAPAPAQHRTLRTARTATYLLVLALRGRRRAGSAGERARIALAPKCGLWYVSGAHPASPAGRGGTGGRVRAPSGCARCKVEMDGWAVSRATDWRAGASRTLQSRDVAGIPARTARRFGCSGGMVGSNSSTIPRKT
jgi:hypothetical protein